MQRFVIVLMWLSSVLGAGLLTPDEARASGSLCKNMFDCSNDITQWSLHWGNVRDNRDKFCGSGWFELACFVQESPWNQGPWKDVLERIEHSGWLAPAINSRWYRVTRRPSNCSRTHCHVALTAPTMIWIPNHRCNRNPY